MRCKCCNSSKTKYIYDDWYCYECADVIRETIREDNTDAWHRLKDKNDGEA